MRAALTDHDALTTGSTTVPRVGGRRMQDYPLGIETKGTTILLDQKERLQHIHAVGATGTGKTNFLKGLVLADINAGRGCSVIDPHGDFVDDIANSIPAHRMRDVIYFDPLADKVISYNPLKTVPPLQRSTLAEQLASTFQHIFAETWGQSRLQYIFTNTIRLLLDNPDTTLVDMPKVLTDKDFRDALLENCSDPYVKAFWHDEFDRMPDKQQKEAIAPIQNKVGQFVTNPILRNIIGHKSTIDIREMMDAQKIVLWNLSKAKMADTPSRIFGSALVTGYLQAGYSRDDTPEDQRVPHYLYIDEVHNFVGENFATVLSESRKYALGLVTAHQYLDQVKSILPAIVGNVGTTVVFRVGPLDVPLLSLHLGLQNTNILLLLPDHQAWTKAKQGLSPTIYQLKTILAPGPTGSLAAVKRRSQAGLGRPRTL